MAGWQFLVIVFNAFHAADECRRQVKNLTKFVKNVEIVEFHDIWNHYEKYIEISTNIPGIGSIIREIAIKMSINVRKQTQLCSVQPMAAF